MLTFADKYLRFLQQLQWPATSPAIEVMNPYADSTAWNLTEAFYRKYYSDQSHRTLIIGINPGRFGGGITGIPFTDPVRLQEACGIPNDLAKKQELSSNFIYQMITALGGPGAFYCRYLFSAVSPVGFTLGGKNLNYYDHPELKNAAWQQFMVDCLQQQLAIGADQKIAYVLGQGENLKFLSRLNEQYKFFAKLEVLPHPRWIMQYRLKKLSDFIEVYRQKLGMTPL